MLDVLESYRLVKRVKVPSSRGVPIDLDGYYHDQALVGGADNPINYPWYHYDNESPFDLPDPMYFVCKHRVIDFDFYHRTDGYILSERFFDIVARMRVPNYVYRRIHILNNKAEEITEQKYYFLRFERMLNVIDLERSEWYQDRYSFVDNGRPLTASAFGSELNKPLIGVVRNPVFTKLAADYDFFNVANTSFQMDACSDLFYREADKLKMKGVAFVKREDFFDVVNEIDFGYFDQHLQEFLECEEMYKEYLASQT